MPSPPMFGPRSVYGSMSIDSSLGYDARDAARRRLSPEEVLQTHDSIVAPPPPVLVMPLSFPESPLLCFRVLVGFCQDALSPKP